MGQVHQSRKSAKGRRWNESEKTLALSLCHSSPRTYRLLRRIFALPAISTLRKIVARVDIRPGFSINILEALRMKIANIPPQERLVSLVLDEMSIKEGVLYDKKHDIVEGFEHTTECSNKLANHALVFMVRGLLTKWKLPFGYFLSSGVIPAAVMKPLLFQAVDKLMDIGLTVMVVISDQGSNNVSMFESGLGISPEKPFFHHRDCCIFVMYDPPHLVKSVRNNLKNHGFLVDGHDVLWQHIQDFYDDDSSRDIRLAPRLTKLHLNLPPFAPLRVRLATQVLSHSVAAGISVMVDWKRLPEGARHTATFCERMDQLFNCFNSSSISSPARMRHAMTSTSSHDEFLQDSLKWIDSIKTKGSRTPSCLKGWKISISSLLLLWKDLNLSHGIKFLLTNRLNQDCVENLFSLIRAKGAQRDNPNSRDFRAALRQVMVDGVMAPIYNSNCQEDVDKFLVNLASSSSQPSSASSSAVTQEAPSACDAALEQLPTSMQQVVTALSYSTPGMDEDDKDDDLLDHHDTNVLVYIGGYIVHKLKDVMCANCLSKLSCSLDIHQPSHQFLMKKNYQSARTGLVVPSTSMVEVLEQIEKRYREVCEITLQQKNVMVSLVQHVEKCDLSNIQCDECHVEKAVMYLMLRIRLHHTLRENNREISLSKRKNRKTLKFCHR